MDPNVRRVVLPIWRQRAVPLWTAFCLAAAGIPAAGWAASVSNTAQFLVDGRAPLPSNTVRFDTVPPPTPASVDFFQYVPGNAQATLTPADGTQCANAVGNYSPVTGIRDVRGTPIDSTAAAPLIPARAYHAGEPVYIVLRDGNRNADPALRESIELRVTTSEGDREDLRLLETGPDTGVFAGVVQSQPIPPPVVINDCRLSGQVETTLSVDYEDAFYPGDTAQDRILIDPLGRVFSSANGSLVDGASVTLIDLTTGQPATVFCDDGVTRCPSTVISGDASRGLPPGSFRFPFVESGRYRVDVVPPAGFAGPSTVPLARLQGLRDPDGDPYLVVDASFSRPFDVVGPIVQFDYPLDPPTSSLLMQKGASSFRASSGDHLQYRLTLTNTNSATPATGVTITDVLPPGLRYVAGSLTVGGAAAADPQIAADGRTLTFPVGTLAPSGTVTLSYVVLVGSGAVEGSAVNRARASADGAVQSNEAQAEVAIRPAFFGDRYTLIGRVLDGECGLPPEQLKGVPGVRVMLDDGTYTASDHEGQFHFEGVRQGTRVVQLDLDSIPADYEVVPCIRNSRFAGRSYSQFVDARGGALWRTDFHLRPRPPVSSSVGVQLATERAGPTNCATEQPDPACPPPRQVRYTVESQFDTLEAEMTPALRQSLDSLAAQLRGKAIVTVRVVGHTDNQPILARARQRYADNTVLSAARARTAAEYLQKVLQLPAERVVAEGAGESQPLVDNATEDGRRQNRRVEVSVFTREPMPPMANLRYTLRLDGGEVPVDNLRATVVLPPGARLLEHTVTVDGVSAPAPQADDNILTFRLGKSEGRFVREVRFEALAASVDPCGEAATSKVTLGFDALDARNQRTPVVHNQLSCEAGAPAQAQTERAEASFKGKRPPRAATTTVYQRKPVAEDRQAAGYGIDWLRGATPGTEWLFPPANHNPRAPAVRVAIKHAPGTRVRLKLAGEPVSGLNFEGTDSNADKTVAVSQWSGVDIRDGDNAFTAEILDADGKVLDTLSRSVRFAGSPVRAELVAAESLLSADGLRRPVLAVRFVDRDNRPVRHGITGPFQINAPYVPAQYEEYTRKRALAGLDNFKPFYKIDGDEGVAYIELAPTTESGEVVLRFNFGDERRDRIQEIRAWLAADQRDWIVVGYGEGTVGYSTLKGRQEALPPGTEEGLNVDGRVSLYAKGRIKGEWLMTLAYDSGKPPEEQRRESLRQVIDPEQYYTLYGDGAEQRHDAASQEKLYLKLERPQFYALFGDYDTGLTQSLLSRYSRALSGVKSEYSGSRFSYVAYAAETGQRYARDELPGDGTSGLYRLSRRDIVINSESIRLEVRDRFRSENVISTQTLVRHIDYDIDYGNATLFFRKPVPSRDSGFNPIFIVAEYESRGTDATALNAGGRAAVTLMDGRVTAGLSYLHDADSLGETDLGGVDVKLRVGEKTELRVEGAHSQGDVAGLERDGGAFVAELEHRGDQLDALAYVRRQDGGFGVLQQNASESGTQKAGVDARYQLNEALSLQGQLFRQENLQSELTRDVAGAELEYSTERSGASLGLQAATDTDASGDRFESQQVTAGLMRRFFGNRLELEGRTEMSLGDKNQSIDYPTRYLLQSGWQVTDSAKLILAHEITDGDVYDTSTTRIGGQMTPWRGAKLDSTLNQQSSEFGPRTFSVLGLTQTFLIGEAWGLDFTLDRSDTIRSSGTPPPQFNSSQPLASGSLTEDFMAVTGGATYRAPLWSWNGRVEYRDGDSAQRWGLSTGFLREAQAGVAFSSLARVFRSELGRGGSGVIGELDLSWAWRPLGSRYSMLDRLEIEYGTAVDGGGFGFGLGSSFDGVGTTSPGTGSGGGASLAEGTRLKTRKLINNFNLNRVSREWTAEDRQGNLLALYERQQWSLYYGAKYVFDSFDSADYRGYTDLIAIEWRWDVKPWMDVGLQASQLHSWSTNDRLYSLGPQFGFNPMENAWITVGYNAVGFRDRDFDQAEYTAQGPYLKLRFKFDQNTRLGPDRKTDKARGWDEPPSRTAGVTTP